MARRRSLPWVRAGLRWDTWPPWPRLPPVVLSRAPARAVLQPAPSTDTGYQASAATLPLRSDYRLRSSVVRCSWVFSRRQRSTSMR